MKARRGRPFKRGFDERRNYHGRTRGAKSSQVVRRCPRCGLKFRESRFKSR